MNPQLRHGSRLAILACSGLLMLGAGGSRAEDQARSARFAPTDRYEVREIEGWEVRVNAQFLREDAALANRALALLRHQLEQIARRLPGAAVQKLRAIRIWVEEAEPHHPCMAYHPDAGWLRDHDMNPDKARGIEVANARNFLTWTQTQPWMVLHELAHGYHHQFLEEGFQNREVLAAYRQAIEGKRYEAVMSSHGNQQPAYAIKDPMEYFAEASEAFFGTNDFYPFVRPELRHHDPKMFDLLTTLWGE